MIVEPSAVLQPLQLPDPEVARFLADERSEMLPIHLWQQIETNLDVRTAAVSGLIVMFTLILMLLAERLAGLTRQMR